MKQIRHLIKKAFLKNYGRHYRWKNGNRSELKKIMFAVQCILIALICAVVFVLIDAFYGLFSSVIADIVLLLSFIAAYYLINQNFIALGKLLIFIAANSILLVNGSSQGRSSGNFFLFFPIITSIFSLFSAKEIRYIAISLILTFANFAFLEYTDYSFLKSSQFPSSYEYPNYLTSLIISAIMVSYFSYFYSKSNTNTENKLQRLNTRLKIQNQKLTKTNSELDTFVYKASHDLRAPLTSLLGLINISQTESDLQKLRSYAYLQEKLIRKLDMFIMDILTISRNSNLVVQTEPIHFEALIEQSLEQLQYLENYPRIEKNIQINESGSPFYSDQKRIIILLNNLFSNAIRYADLSKEKPFLSVQVTFLPEEVLIELFDNGIGIDDSHLGKVFKMFYRATDKNAGSGLGLYIVQEVIDKLKGKIVVSSEVGKWTRFDIRLPNMEETNGLPTSPTKVDKVESSYTTKTA